MRRCHEPRSSAAVVLAPVLTYFTGRGSSANKQRLYCTLRGSPPVAAGPGCDDVQVTWAGDTHTQHLQHHQEFKKVGAVGGGRVHPSHVVRGGCPSARHVTTTQAYNTDTHAAGVQTTTHTDTHPQGVTRAPRAALACSPLPPGATGLSLPAPLGNTSDHTHAPGVPSRGPPYTHIRQATQHTTQVVHVHWQLSTARCHQPPPHPPSPFSRGCVLFITCGTPPAATQRISSPGVMQIQGSPPRLLTEGCSLAAGTVTVSPLCGCHRMPLPRVIQRHGMAWYICPGRTLLTATPIQVLPLARAGCINACRLLG